MKVRVLLAVCLLPLFAVSLLAQNQPAIFPTMGTYESRPIFAGVVGDFNGDGLPDFAYYRLSAPQGPIDLVTLLNQGGDNDPVVVSTPFNCDGALSFSMAAADMNKDGKLDLVQVCNNYVVVVSGNGDGSFQIPSSTAYYSISGSLDGIVSPIDLNGDGYPDVVVGSKTTGSTSTSVAVFLNQGSSSPGVLLAPRMYPFPDSTQVWTITGIGDFNGDGKQDVIGNPSTSGQMAIFLGNGDGTLEAGVTQTQQSARCSAYSAIGDFNNDGYTDIVCSISASPSQYLQAFLGSLNGSLTSGPVTNLHIPYTTTSGLVAIGKNGDNNLDLAAVGDNTQVLQGYGNGTFAIGQSYAISGAVYPLPLDNTGKEDLLFSVSTSDGLYRLKSNGDGTYQAPLNTFTGPNGFVTADVNNDGLTDAIWIESTIGTAGGLYIGLGRGDGTFTVLNVYTAPFNGIIVPGDINGDGNFDIVTVLPGTEAHSGTPAVPARISSFTGDGFGNFKPGDSSVSLQVYGATNAVLGDFNGDGKLDALVSYFGPVSNITGVVFVPGNGDGTFGTPVPFAQKPSSIAGGPLLIADLNNDGRLDFIWNGTSSVYLGNGDGTFRQIPLGLVYPVQAQAVGDLNGDGKVDLIAGSSVYAGNGDGSFQSAPLFTYSSGNAPVVIGDVNGDGNPDLLTVLPTTDRERGLTVFLGSGNGNFVIDSNSYVYPNLQPNASFIGSVARLNSNAPAFPNDRTLDFLAVTNNGATSLLNQLNAAPAAPQPVPSRTQLSASVNITVTNQQLSLTAKVTGLTPTGTVTFFSGTTTMGTASVDRITGNATLSTTFAVVGNYSVTANYAGDPNNGASASNAVSVKVLPPSTTTISGAPTNAIVGQTVTFTSTVSGVSPTGTVLFRRSGPTGDRSPVLGQGTITNGLATFSTSFPQPGTYVIYAEYPGDDNNYGSFSNGVVITVTQSPTKTTLAVSSANANQAQAITYTATVTGATPTGSVVFSSGATLLGISTVNNGVATLSASFATAGTYSVTASYSGDSNNQASTSSAVSITVVAPDFSLTTNPASATVKSGQSATFAINMTAVGGYSGTVNLSCGSLPAGAACNFSNKTLSGSTTTTSLTITTTAPTAMLERPGPPSTRIAVWALLLGLCLSPKRVLRSRKHLARIMTALLLTMGSALYLAGCSSSSTSKDTGTPVGTQTISVSGADSGSGPSHSLNLQLIVQ